MSHFNCFFFTKFTKITKFENKWTKKLVLKSFFGAFDYALPCCIFTLGFVGGSLGWVEVGRSLWTVLVQHQIHTLLLTYYLIQTKWNKTVPGLTEWKLSVFSSSRSVAILRPNSMFGKICFSYKNNRAHHIYMYLIRCVYVQLNVQWFEIKEPKSTKDELLSKINLVAKKTCQCRLICKLEILFSNYHSMSSLVQMSSIRSV